MKTRTNRILTGALVTGALSLGIAAPVFGQEAGAEAAGTRDRPASVEDAKTRCLAGIERRQTTLLELEARIGGSEALTDAHESALIGIVDGTQAGLEGLAGQIGAATTAEELRALCPTIATDFRVYLVVAPQVHLTVGADHVDGAVARGGDALARLDEAIAAVAAGGADVTEAQAHRDAAAARIAEADAATEGTADAVLGVTPAAYNEGAGGPILADARADLRDARDDLTGARAEFQAAVEALRSIT